MNEINLYIPTGVKAENELFNGFGRRELLQSAIGSLFGGAVAALLWLIAGNVALTVVPCAPGEQSLAAIEKALNAKVMVSLSCTMCPEVVMATQRVASLSEHVRAEMVVLDQLCVGRRESGVREEPAFKQQDFVFMYPVGACLYSSTTIDGPKSSPFNIILKVNGYCKMRINNLLYR